MQACADELYAHHLIACDTSRERYHLQAPVWEFAHTLGPAPEHLRGRHAAHYAARAARASAARGRGDADGLRELQREREHLLSGWRWAAIQGQLAPLCLTYAGAVGDLLDRLLPFAARIELLGPTLTLTQRQAPPALRARLLVALGDTLLQSDPGDSAAPDAIAHFDQVLLAAPQERALAARAALGRGAALARLGQEAQAHWAYLRALTLAQMGGAAREASLAMGNLGNILARSGDLEGAVEHYERALGLAEALNDRRVEVRLLRDGGVACALLGWRLLRAGRNAEAQRYLQRASASFARGEAAAEAFGDETGRRRTRQDRERSLGDLMA